MLLLRADVPVAPSAVAVAVVIALAVLGIDKTVHGIKCGIFHRPSCVQTVQPQPVPPAPPAQQGTNK